MHAIGLQLMTALKVKAEIGNSFAVLFEEENITKLTVYMATSSVSPQKIPQALPINYDKCRGTYFTGVDSGHKVFSFVRAVDDIILKQFCKRRKENYCLLTFNCREREVPAQERKKLVISDSIENYNITDS